MASTPDSWSNIPLDLAVLVLRRLSSHVDRVRFAAVCPQWHSASRQVRLPPAMPLLALKEGDVFYSMPRGEPLHFAGCETGFATACGKWLVYRRVGDLLLVDPFSGATMTLPALSSVHEAGVIKLMVCSPDLIASLFHVGEFNQIAVCRPGGSMWSVARDLSLWITDMAFYQGKLYVVDYDEDLLALDISVDDNTGDPRVAQIGRVINVNHFDDEWTFDDERTLLRMLYLVELCGSLLLVRRRIFRMHIHGDGHIHTFAGQHEPDLSMFEADFGRSQWVKVTALPDDQALFLGPSSRAVGMPQGDSLGNRVWFLDDYKDFHLWSDSTSVKNPRPFSPLPMISWRGYQGNAGAAWLFPAN